VLLGSVYRAADAVRHRIRSRTWRREHAAGRRGEDLAHRHLQRQGFIVVGRNYLARSGLAELDVIAWEGDRLVFVEVKTRATGEFGPPDRAIDEQKRRHILRAAREYSRKAGVDWQHVRFDIVGVVLSPRPEITHFRDVFPVSDSR
jgi:putative endonuclease